MGGLMAIIDIEGKFSHSPGLLYICMDVQWQRGQARGGVQRGGQSTMSPRLALPGPLIQEAPKRSDCLVLFGTTQAQPEAPL
mmetsp:Transcript_22410/g.57400  ORF Transcript_22410/g.57400 Transcript_22410/m.57400 type:complete len:82 (-) Transcript_22410:527-772(-)